MQRRAGAAAVALWAFSVAPADAEVRSATFAAGCFWCVEAAFAGAPGVIGSEVGYVPAPAPRGNGAERLEALSLQYDDEVTSFRHLLVRFLLAIDPSDPEGQFCERGPEKRTAVVVASAEERAAAEAALARTAEILGRPVATMILAPRTFEPAPAPHQDYARRNPLRFDFWMRACGREAGLRALWTGPAVVALERDP